MPRASVYSQYKVLGKDPINVFILAILQTSQVSLMLFFAQGLKGCTYDWSTNQKINDPRNIEHLKEKQSNEIITRASTMIGEKTRITLQPITVLDWDSWQACHTKTTAPWFCWGITIVHLYQCITVWPIWDSVVLEIIESDPIIEHFRPTGAWTHCSRSKFLVWKIFTSCIALDLKHKWRKSPTGSFYTCSVWI